MDPVGDKLMKSWFANRNGDESTPVANAGKEPTEEEYDDPKSELQQRLLRLSAHGFTASDIQYMCKRVSGKRERPMFQGAVVLAQHFYLSPTLQHSSKREAEFAAARYALKQWTVIREPLILRKTQDMQREKLQTDSVTEPRMPNCGVPASTTGRLGGSTSARVDNKNTALLSARRKFVAASQMIDQALTELDNVITEIQRQQIVQVEQELLEVQQRRHGVDSASE